MTTMNLEQLKEFRAKLIRAKNFCQGENWDFPRSNLQDEGLVSGLDYVIRGSPNGWDWYYDTGPVLREAFWKNSIAYVDELIEIKEGK
jgi:hypothetical protein